MIKKKIATKEQAIQTKFHNIEVQEGKAENEELVIDFTVERVDRDNEVLLVSGAKLSDYRKNPIILADHEFSVSSLVGSFEWVKLYPNEKPDRIRGKPRFSKSDFARQVEQDVRDKHLKTVSHTFLGWEYVDDEDSIKELGFNPKEVNRIFTKWEPLEVSFVAVPANQDAMAHYISSNALKSKHAQILAELEQKDKPIEGQKPTPREGEAEEDFVQRCMPILIDEGKKPDEAAAICHSMWREAQKSEELESYDSINEIKANKEFLLTELNKLTEKINEFHEYVNKLRLQVEYLEAPAQDPQPESGEQGEEDDLKVLDVLSSTIQNFKIGGD